MVRMLWLFKVAASLVALGYASYCDVKTREVDDAVWILLGAAGLILTVIEVVTRWPVDLYIYIVGVATGFLLGLALYYVFRFGGADAKAFWALGLMFPVLPRIPVMAGRALPIFILTIFNNSIACSLLAVVENLARNVVWRVRYGWIFKGYEGGLLKRALLVLVARRVTIEEALRNRFLVSVEAVDPDGRRRVSLFSTPLGDIREIDFEDASQRLPPGVEGSLWVEAPQPFILYLLLGLLVSIFWGDIFLTLILSMVKG